MKKIATSNELFDILDQIGDNKFVTIGYVTGANLDVPKIKRRNPETNRMKGYDDYTVFQEEGDEGEIGALVKVSSYNMRYRNRTSVNKQYGDWKQGVNKIRGDFGLEPMGTKDKDEKYKASVGYGEHGIETYVGKNDDIKDHSYNPQNVYGVVPKSEIYAVNTEGHIIKKLSKEQVLPYLKAKNQEVSGVSALRKMNATEEEIQDYISQVNALKMRYINFENGSILWIAATVDGEKYVFINDRLSRVVNDIDINTEDFVKIAKERYAKDLQSLDESYHRSNRVRITESQIRQMVRRALNEVGFKSPSLYHREEDPVLQVASSFPDIEKHIIAVMRFCKAVYKHDGVNDEFYPKLYRDLDYLLYLVSGKGPKKRFD